MRKHVGRIAGLVLAGCFAAGLAVAQCEDCDHNDSSYGNSGAGGGRDDTTSAYNQATAVILRVIQKDSERCSSFPWVYRYDCIRYVFADAATARTQQPSAYRKAQEILGGAAQKLDALVTQNVDPEQPPSRIGKRVIRPVKQTARAEVSEAARAIVTETETLLLRSGGSAKRQFEYDKIAAAVSSTELLLRSALQPLPGVPHPAIAAMHRFAALALLARHATG